MDDDAPGEVLRASWPALPSWLVAPLDDILRQRARFPHALLVTGPEGVGKRVLALHVARAMLCESPGSDGSACGRCDGCHLVEAAQHPDLAVVEPFDVDDEGVRTPVDWIRIAQIRRLIEWTQVTSHRRRAKLAVIAPGEAMQYDSANALLKTLEEPPAGTYLVIVAHRPGRLPPTIASRCQRRVVTLPEAEVALRWLGDQGARDARRLLAQAGGAPYRALALADAAYQAERAAWIEALAQPERLSPVALAARIDLAGRDERRDRLAAALDWLIGWTTDLARALCGGSAGRDPERAADLARLASRVARISLFVYHRNLLRQRALASHPLQPRLVAEALLIEYRALFNR